MRGKRNRLFTTTLWASAIWVVAGAIGAGCSKRTGTWVGQVGATVEFSGQLKASPEEISEAGLLCWRALTHDKPWAARAAVFPNPMVHKNQPGPGGAVFWGIRVSKLSQAEAKECERERQTFRTLMKDWLERRCEGTEPPATKPSS